MNGRTPRWISVLLVSAASVAIESRAGDAPGAHSPSGITNLAVLIDALDRTPGGSVSRDVSGNLVRLTMPLSTVSDTNLESISKCMTLQELDLRFSTKDYPRLTHNGFDQLRHLPRLIKLQISCPQYIEKNCFASVCQLTNLRSLTLRLAPPAGRDYFLLTNLVQLAHLSIEGADTFGDSELSYLRGLQNLQELRLLQTAVSDRWLNIARAFPELTNAVVHCLTREFPQRIESVTWSRYRR